MSFRASLLLVGAFVSSSVLVRDARACGGTFCDSAPSAMPVDQSGENILFVMDGSTVEAHIQIQYKGAASRFAWVLPMPTVPSFAVGSQALFTNLLAATVPSYGVSVQQDFCGVDGGGSGCSCAGGASADRSFEGGGGGTFLSSHASTGSGSGPQVVDRETVGAFDVTVLQGGTAQEVSDWLTTNGYRSTADTPALLQTYVDKSYVFVAVKLAPGAGVDEIHPLVVRYPGDMPCVPLVLTSVAARADMPVRVFFLGEDRWYPENWWHVTPNPARLDWVNNGSNYDAVVAHAVDAPPAKGHAFVTEYAGSTGVVSMSGLGDMRWDAQLFVGIAPEDVVTELGAQGLAVCTSFACTWTHPLVASLLDEYLPVPPGVTPDAFYVNTQAYANMIDQNAWSALGFARDFRARIVEPALDAIHALQDSKRLTRMLTIISPDEMTEDPTFLARPDLNDENVPTLRLGVQNIACDGTQGMTLPDGDQVALANDGSWPRWSESMPWALRVEHVATTGETKVDLDEGPTVDKLLDAWNGKQGWPDGSGSQAGGGGCTAVRGRPSTSGLAVGVLALSALLRRRRRQPRA